jgi:predicted lipoprotein with Yx(FWY)xxD motif
MSHIGNRRNPSHRARALLAGTALAALAVVGVSTVAPAASAQATVVTTQTVVQIVHRTPVGHMLASVKGASLYTNPSSCRGGCLSAWPRLLMATGRTVPVGATGLGTVTVNIGGVSRLQVTFHGKRLYRFVADSGSSVNGNNLEGFVAART